MENKEPNKKKVAEFDYFYSNYFYKKSIKDELNVLCKFKVKRDKLIEFLKTFKEEKKSLRLIEVSEEKENEYSSKVTTTIIAYSNIGEVDEKGTVTACTKLRKLANITILWSKYQVNEMTLLSKVLNYDIYNTIKKHFGDTRKVIEFDFISSMFGLIEFMYKSTPYIYYKGLVFSKEESSNFCPVGERNLWSVIYSKKKFEKML